MTRPRPNRFAALAAAALIGAATHALAPAAAAAPAMRKIEGPRPRTLSALDLQLLHRPVFDPAPRAAKPPLRPSPNDYSSFWSPSAPLVPPPAAEPTDGAFAPTAVYSYQPRMTTSFYVPDPDSAASMPADCTIAAGAGHLVVAYNSRIAFYAKDGTRVFTATLGAFLGALPGWKGHFDPKVVYDEGAGRFYVVALDYHLSARQSRWTVAVSVSGDPTQGWYVYDLRNELDGLGVDYEEIGFGPRAIYLSGNYLNFQDWSALPPPTATHNSTMWVLDKAAMLAGQTFTFWTHDDVTGDGNVAVNTPKVALVHGTPFGGVDGFMTAFLFFTGPPAVMRVYVWGITLPGDFPAGAPVLVRTSVNTDDPGPPPNASQLGGPALLQTNNLGLAPMNLQFRNNTLTLATAAASGARSRARVIHLSCAWPTVTLAWQNDFLDGVNHHFWPQVAVNARGQAGLAYCRSGNAEFAGFRWTTRTPDDPGFLASNVVKAGEGYVGNPLTDTGATLFRWGDYSGVAVDPVTQGFWFFGKYGSPRGFMGNQDFRLWAGYVPRAVYVDGGHAGSEFGTTQRPWNTMAEAVNDAFTGNDVVVKAGTYATPGTIAKPLTIFADGGAVTLQP